jgi:formate hydrogenlyase subunit 3/multisubunit Na+/H+ antiporter MnhD subunit
MSAALLGSALALPLLLLLASASARLRPVLLALFPVAPIPALAASLFAQTGSMVAFGYGRAALRFSLDLPGAMLLGTAAVLWIFAGLYAAAISRNRPDRGGFVISWLMTLTGCVGVFLAADLISFYFLLAVLSVGASGLVFQGEGREALRASATYLGLALFAEGILLAGLILLAQAVPNGSLLIRDAAAALPHSPWRDVTLVLLLAGLGIKAGLVPLHFWMPLAYGAAPIPAAAVMSGAAVKASILAMIRFLPLGIALPEFGHPLAVLGLIGAFYGVAIGITQSRPEIILAYSSVSQMGFLVAVIGMGMAAGDTGTALAASFYAAHHLLVKGALFLAVGLTALTGGRHLRPILLPAAIIALGLGGLPLTGGALAKYAAKDLMGSGFAATAAAASSVATTLLMLHFLQRLRLTGANDSDARPPRAATGAWLAMAFSSLALPWTLYLAIPLDTLAKAIAPAALWSALWPVLIGAGLAVALNRFGAWLPRIPPGDFGSLAMSPFVETGVAAGRLFVRADAFARRWAVACIALLLASLMFGWSLMAGS